MFRRALEHGNLLLAEATAREVGRIDLREELELTALIAKQEHERLPRLGARWLQRWLEKAPAPTLEDALLVLGCLCARGGPQHNQSLLVLRDVVRLTTSPGARCGIA